MRLYAFDNDFDMFCLGPSSWMLAAGEGSAVSAAALLEMHELKP